MRISSGFYLILLIFISGCAIQSRQLNAFLEVIREPALDLKASSWLARYSDYESVVYSVVTPDGILFSNSAGDQILFDGWAMRKVRGFGEFQLNINIEDVSNVRSFKMGTRVLSTHRCDQWEQRANLERTKYTQACSGLREYKNSILVRDTGDISVIRQIVDNRYFALTLTKLE